MWRASPLSDRTRSMHFMAGCRWERSSLLAAACCEGSNRPVSSTMPNLKLKVSRAMEVVNADAEIEVRSTDGELIGRLLVSKGSVDWAPANKQLRHRLRWKQFARLMESEGRLVR